MPYVPFSSRDNINELCSNLSFGPMPVGELNYTISRLLHKWIKANGMCYTSINSAIGVLECAKLELYRQIAAPYEDEKKAENGSVSELDK